MRERIRIRIETTPEETQSIVSALLSYFTGETPALPHYQQPQQLPRQVIVSSIEEHIERRLLPWRS